MLQRPDGKNDLENTEGNSGELTGGNRGRNRGRVKGLLIERS